ncbi:MAG: DNA polymerase/3'-5' exonuclease PolX [Baekduia sp.]
MADRSNAEIADAFEELADLYELDGAIVHRVLAYRNAAKAVRDAPRSVAELTRAGTVTSLAGIGKTLEEKITALLDTGTIPSADKLRAKYPAGVLQLTRLPGLGPKRARTLYAELGVDSLDALHEAAKEGRLKTVKGLGPKFQQAVLEAFAAGVAERPEPRLLPSRALELAEELCDALREADVGVVDVEPAGGLRRLTESVKDIDLVASADDPSRVTAALAGLSLIDEETASNPGENAARGRTHNGVAVDLRVVTPDRYGNLLQHFTGSKAHNAKLREQAVRRGLHVSEYGIADDESGETTRCATEEQVYERLGLPWIPPELREDRGELEPGWQSPRLIELADLRGDLHCHTVASDGLATVEELAELAVERRLEYLAITDHSATHGFGNHVTADDLRRQIDRVHELNERLPNLELLIGTETNILPDGRPDYPDDVLEQLDWTIGSVHTSFGMERHEMTARIITAIEHPWIDCIGHLTGRRIEKRPGYDVDVDAVIEAAARTGTMLEINASIERRDLREIHARQAVDAGVHVVINTDAHRPDRVGNPVWGVATARRAGLEAKDIANTLPWSEFAPLRKHARS